MKRTKGFAVCMAAAMATSVVMSATAMAGEDTIAIPYQQEDAWSQIAVTNDATVSTGVNIRSSASEDSKVIGYLYHGGAAWVLNRGAEWTEIYSGGLTGFVKNEYLVYGADAEGIAQSHGIEGVATTWDDVKLYADMDGGSKVLDSLEYGDSFILTEAGSHWIQVQNGADSVAYVSAEDVSRVLLMDTAVAVDAVYPGTTGTYEPAAAGNGSASADTTYADTNSGNETSADQTGADTTYTDNTYTDNTDTDTTYTDDTYTDDTYTDDTYTDDTYTDDTYTDDTYTDDTYTDDSDDESYYDADADTMVNGGDSAGETYTAGTGQESYYDPETGIYYDASTGLYYDSGTGILYDAWWNPVYEGATPPQTEAPQTEAPETEAPQTEPAQTEPSYTTGSDDTTLLAALIYCEAGNQSYEGMVAVGAVVMNRVYSPSFPNTISDVIYQSGQFTPAYSGALSSALANGVPSACYDAAVAAIGGENPVGGALYFNTGSGKGMKLGDHQFY